MKTIIDPTGFDRVRALLPKDLRACGVSIDHDNAPLVGGIVKDEDGLKFWAVSADEQGQPHVIAGLATLVTARYTLPPDASIAEAVKNALNELKA